MNIHPENYCVSKTENELHCEKTWDIKPGEIHTKQCEVMQKARSDLSDCKDCTKSFRHWAAALFSSNKNEYFGEPMQICCLKCVHSHVHRGSRHSDILKGSQEEFTQKMSTQNCHICTFSLPELLSTSPLCESIFQPLANIFTQNNCGCNALRYAHFHVSVKAPGKRISK